MGELFGPEHDGMRRRANLQALLSRVCDMVRPECFSAERVLLDGVPLLKPALDPAADLRGGSL